MKEIEINVEGVSLVEFYGVNNRKLDLLKRAFPGLKITSRGAKVRAAGNNNEVMLFNERVNAIMEFLRRYGHLSLQNLEGMLEGVSVDNLDVPKRDSNIIVYGNRGKVVKARTPNQVRLVEESENNDIVFAIGPAGTGKTYTAVALAVKALKAKLVRRIILARPAVEAGESLGFLPGDLKDKIDPYLRPLYDALDDLIPPDKLDYYMRQRVIEIAPLAYMRGRTLDDAFIILDEAQNTTEMQIRMFLTRIGPSAKCIITGDLTQIDLPMRVKSGLRKSVEILSGIKGIGTVYLDEEDVIRHKLVKQIIKAYERSDNSNAHHRSDAKRPSVKRIEPSQGKSAEEAEEE